MLWFGSSRSHLAMMPRRRGRFEGEGGGGGGGGILAVGVGDGRWNATKTPGECAW